MYRINSNHEEKIKKPTAVALGFFDGVHLGHKAVISRAVQLKEQGLVPCVFTFLTNQNTPFFKKGQKLIATESSKERWIQKLGVECLAAFDFEDIKDLSCEDFVSEILVKKLYAKALCCGEDFRFGKDATGDILLLKKLCAKQQIDLYVINKITDEGVPISSTRIRGLIECGDMESAARLMGKEFSIDFTVIKGRQLGRSLNFPTINQAFCENFVMPKFGVYATYTIINNKKFASVTNVGLKPTVGSEYPLSETYICNFSGDLYGQKVEVCFLKFMRPEIKFNNIPELKDQIQTDLYNAQNIFKVALSL